MERFLGGWDIGRSVLMGGEKIQDHGLLPGRKGLTQEVTSLGMGVEWKEDLKISPACFLTF